MLRDSPIGQIMLLRHDYVHRIGRKVAMLLRIWRFAAIYLTAPTLSLNCCRPWCLVCCRFSSERADGAVEQLAVAGELD